MKPSRRKDKPVTIKDADATPGGIIKIPTLLELYGNRIFYAIIVVALIALFIRYRINAGHEAARRASESLTLARANLTELHDMSVFNPNAAQLAGARTQLVGDV